MRGFPDVSFGTWNLGCMAWNLALGLYGSRSVTKPRHSRQLMWSVAISADSDAALTTGLMSVFGDVFCLDYL